MPKRHNVFQDLMASIHQQLAAPCRMVESEMLQDAVSGQTREVDLVIRSTIADYELVISVECTDKKRPVSVVWVEQMCAKHRDLPTHKLVLISKSGFSKAAIEKAHVLGAEPSTLEGARQVNWAKYVGRHLRLFFAAIDALTVVIPDSPTFAPDCPHHGIPMKTEFVDPEGMVRATAEEIAHAVLAREQILAATIGKMDVKSSAGWEVIIPMKSGVQMRFPGGSEHSVRQVKIAILANPLSVSFDLANASFRDAQIAFGTSKTKYGDFLLTMVESEGEKPSGEVRVRRPWGEVQNYPLAGDDDPAPKAASDQAMSALIGFRS